MRGHKVEMVSALLMVTVGSAAAQNNPVTEVFFRFDSSALSTKATEQLDAAAHEALGEPGTKVVIDAHADPRGTAPYNVGLSIRRAESVRDHLVTLGVAEADIVMAHYGEDGAPRETFAEDRRVGITLTRQPLYVIIDRALPEATAVTWERPATTAEVDGPPGRDLTARL